MDERANGPPVIFDLFAVSLFCRFVGRAIDFEEPLLWKCAKMMAGPIKNVDFQKPPVFAISIL